MMKRAEQYIKYKNTKQNYLNFDPVNIVFEDLLNLRHQAHLLASHVGKIKARQSGTFLSGFKGRGMLFEEVRPYVAGDDIRSLDWKVTARTNKPHTKIYQEEKERPVQICLDLRASMFFATRACFKSCWAARAASLICWSTLLQKDRVGGLIFSEYQHQEFKPQLSSRAVLRILKSISEHKVNNSADKSDKHSASVIQTGNQLGSTNSDTLFYALLRLRRVTKPGSRLFIISDFRGWTNKHESILLQLSKHNDIVLLYCYDPFEAALPTKGVYTVSDGKQDVQFHTGSEYFRSNYQKKFETHKRRFEKFSRIANIRNYDGITTSTPFDVVSQILARVVSQALASK